jgi:hypothetical protein
MTYEFDLHESKEAGKWEMVDAMLAKNYSIEEIVSISKFSKEDILKRKTTLIK